VFIGVEGDYKRRAADRPFFPYVGDIALVGREVTDRPHCDHRRPFAWYFKVVYKRGAAYYSQPYFGCYIYHRFCNRTRVCVRLCSNLNRRPLLISYTDVYTSVCISEYCHIFVNWILPSDEKVSSVHDILSDRKAYSLQLNLVQFVIVFIRVCSQNVCYNLRFLSKNIFLIIYSIISLISWKFGVIK
jgi:hypothetical protein